jgi:putative endonuclease
VSKASLRGNLHLGKEGEDIARDFLSARGYRIITRNFRTRSGEIDIIAADGPVICFVEVKTRRQERFGAPGESVQRLKQRHMAKAAVQYLKSRHLLDAPSRFDVVSIEFTAARPRIDLIQSAFVLDENDEVSDV